MLGAIPRNAVIAADRPDQRCRDVGSHDVDDAAHLGDDAGHIRPSDTRIDQRLELLGGP